MKTLFYFFIYFYNRWVLVSDYMLCFEKSSLRRLRAQFRCCHHFNEVIFWIQLSKLPALTQQSKEIASIKCSQQPHMLNTAHMYPSGRFFTINSEFNLALRQLHHQLAQSFNAPEKWEEKKTSPKINELSHLTIICRKTNPKKEFLTNSCLKRCTTVTYNAMHPFYLWLQIATR